jgi:hypothetical protein
MRTPKPPEAGGRAAPKAFGTPKGRPQALLAVFSFNKILYLLFSTYTLLAYILGPPASPGLCRAYRRGA